MSGMMKKRETIKMLKSADEIVLLAENESELEGI